MSPEGRDWHEQRPERGRPLPAGGAGRLAQLIATRGGTAAPEAPFVIEHREALIYMLCEAAELEHGIMCQYLFAAFSLKQTADEGLTEDQLAAVTPLAQADLARGHAGDAAPGAGAQPAVGDRRRAAPGPAEPAAARLRTTRPACSWRCCRSASRRCAISCSWSGPRGWTCRTPRAWPRSAGPTPLLSERDIVPRRPGLRHGRAPVPVHRGGLRPPGREARRALAVRRPAAGAGDRSSTSAGRSWSP